MHAGDYSLLFILPVVPAHGMNLLVFRKGLYSSVKTCMKLSQTHPRFVSMEIPNAAKLNMTIYHYNIKSPWMGKPDENTGIYMFSLNSLC